MTTPSESTMLSAEDILAIARPAPPSDPGVYFLIRDGVIVYVGQSRHVQSRVYWQSHNKRRDENRGRIVFDEWAVILAPLDEEARRHMEADYINALKPQENITAPAYVCRAGDCDRPVMANGVCQMHRGRKIRHGSYHIGTSTCIWCGDEYQYRLGGGSTERAQRCDDCKHRECAVCGTQFFLRACFRHTAKYCSRACMGMSYAGVKPEGRGEVHDCV